MSIFAGAISRRGAHGIPDSLVAQIRAAISRSKDDAERRTEFADGRLFAVSVDIGALAEPGTFIDGETLARVAGDPIVQLKAGDQPVPRAESLRTIASGLSAGTHEALRSCRGTYCALVYERHSQVLHLMTDKLGVRPVYCWVSPDYVVFATALRILEALEFCATTLDRRGVAETGCFGYPLSDRTQYREIFAFRAAELVTIDISGIHRRRYWKWEELPASGHDAPAREGIYRHFMDAIAVRLRGQQAVAAFLSGGLDSRAIVAALKCAGAKVLAANFGYPNSQDQVLARLTAERLDVRYYQLLQRPLVNGDPYSKKTVTEWLSSSEYLVHHPDRPRVIWSGDGGSVGLGHVYLNAEIVAASRAADLNNATAKFFANNKWHIQTKLLKRGVAAEFSALVESGTRAELESIDSADPGRRFYLFLMLNDQRRHLFNHFENLDIARIELETPFFDSEFVAAIVREPIDPFLRHVFYLEWLKCFPPGVLDVPWQAYPNHVPCPLPLPPGVTYQWRRRPSPKLDDEARRTTLARARDMLRDRPFARSFLDRGRMYAFMLLTRWTSADRSYLLHVPSLIRSYWSRTNAVYNDGRAGTRRATLRSAD